MSAGDDEATPPEGTPERRRLRHRRKGDVDPITKEPITALSITERLDLLETQQDADRQQQWRDRWENRILYLILAGLFVMGGFLYSNVKETARNNERLAREAKIEQRDRVNDFCLIFETKQKSDVDSLAQTYRYLADLTPKQLATPLNRAILANLPRTIREATTDDAPDYCDEPGAAAEKKGARPVGLPEPDDKIPERPPGIPGPGS